MTETDTPRHELGAGGFMDEWVALGPFRDFGADDDRRERFDRDRLTSLGGERGVALTPGATIPLTGPEGAECAVEARKIDADGVVHLEEIYNSGDPTVVYFVAVLVSERAEPVHLYAGCTGPCRLWLNGEMVGDGFVEHPRLHRPGDMHFTCEVRHGENLLLAKVETVDHVATWFTVDAVGESAHKADVAARYRKYAMHRFQEVGVFPHRP